MLLDLKSLARDILIESRQPSQCREIILYIPQEIYVIPTSACTIKTKSTCTYYLAVRLVIEKMRKIYMDDDGRKR